MLMIRAMLVMFALLITMAAMAGDADNVLSVRIKEKRVQPKGREAS
jgi:hypothetical protein